MRDRAARLILTILVVAPASAYGQNATLTARWDSNPPAEQVTHYEVCLGTKSKGCNISNGVVPASQTWYTFAPAPGVLHYVAVRAISGKGKGTLSTEVQVSIPNFVAPSLQKSTINVPIVPLTLNVVDPDGDPLQFSHAGLPLGLSLNPTTGKISGTPTANGTYNVTIAVSDGLATTTRSFVWTIADVTPPVLKVVSHSLGQSVGSAIVTLSGTATDFGAGGSGIVGVKVNGQPAIGGAVTGNAVANWSRNLTLLAGANALTIEATDGAGNVQRLPFTLNLGSLATKSKPMTGASLASSLSGPQAVNTKITFTVSGSGGTAPYQYQWYAQLNGSAQLLRAWNTSNTLTWTPTQSGSYVIVVWARSAGATANTWQAYTERMFSITTATTVPAPPTQPAPPASTAPPAAMSSVSISANRTSPQNVGTSVTFSASGSGGVAPYQYRWYLQSSGGAWQMVRDWMSNASYTWTPSAAGTYNLAVWGRSNGTTAGGYQAYAEKTFVINKQTVAPPPQPLNPPRPVGPPPPPMTSATFGVNLLSPQRVGTRVTFRATGTGGLPPYQYRWYVQHPNGTWQLAVDWSYNDTFSWTPTVKGTYLIAIWTKSHTSLAGGWEAYADQPFIAY